MTVGQACGRQLLLDGSVELRFPHKKLRARVIADYVREAGYPGVVVFSCGNAATALRDEGLDVLEVGPRGDLKVDKWWTPAEIHREWPLRFDATSGHLSAPLMVEIAKAFREHLGDLPAEQYAVPSGSGESIICLRIAYPELTFRAMYNPSKPETRRDPEAPLNAIVDALTYGEEPPWLVQLFYGEFSGSQPAGAAHGRKRRMP